MKPSTMSRLVRTIRRLVGVLPLTAAMTIASCKNLDSPDYRATSLSELTGQPTATTVATAVQGLPLMTRDLAVGSSYGGFVVSFGEIGREGWGLDPDNPDQQARRLETPTRSLGGEEWRVGYQTLRLAILSLHATDGLSDWTTPQKEAVRGWIKTFMAYDLLIIIDVFDQSGAAIDVDRAISDPLPPIVSKAQVFARIVQLLDEAKTHLTAAGTTPFPFTPSAGFAGFSDPPTFLLVNRAIRARVNVYMQNWAAALTDLSQSFIDTTAAMSLGVFHSFSSNSGDEPDPLYDPLPRTQVAHTSTIPDAQLRLDGTPDLRATTKTSPIPPRVLNNITATLKWAQYPTPNSPVPLIKNEELILLRAEANFQLGNRPQALADINTVRVKSGGLQPIADPGPPGMLNEILYNRRYSLLWEGAHRWIDMRRYGRLAQLPRARPGDIVIQYASLTDTECLARSPQPPGCTIPPGL
jgi:hypothetical protein